MRMDHWARSFFKCTLLGEPFPDSLFDLVPPPTSGPLRVVPGVFSLLPAAPTGVLRGSRALSLSFPSLSPRGESHLELSFE